MGGIHTNSGDKQMYDLKLIASEARPTMSLNLIEYGPRPGQFKNEL